MIKITVKGNCANAPKKEFLKAINIAFVKEDLDFLIANVTDNIIWNIIGNKKVEGKEKFIEELEKMKSEKATEFSIEF